MKNWVKDKFKENKDNIIGYSSLVGFAVTLVYTLIAIIRNEWNIDYLTVIITFAVVNILLVLGAIYSIRRYDMLHQEYSKTTAVKEKLQEEIDNLKENIQDETNKQAKIASMFHNFCHEYRKIVSEIKSDLTGQNFSQIESRKGGFEKFLIFAIANIKEIFDILTNDACSVCIKLLDEQMVIRTYMRDNISYRERSIIDKYLPNYSYYHNTAFKNILDEHNPASFYICNNLSTEEKNGHYDNANTKWKKSYNACLVVPIRLITILEEEKEESQIVGFICVDNFKGGFNKRIGLNILASCGDLCFHLFVLFNDLLSKNPAPNK